MRVFLRSRVFLPAALREFRGPRSPAKSARTPSTATNATASAISPLAKEDVRIYFTDGYLIFSKPVAGRRMAAVFTADVEGGDGEVILMPPNRAERRSLAPLHRLAQSRRAYSRRAVCSSPATTTSSSWRRWPNNPTNRKAPEMGAAAGRSSGLRCCATSARVTRLALTLDMLAGPARRPGLFAGAVPAPSSETSIWSTTRAASSRSWPARSTTRDEPHCISTPGRVFRPGPSRTGPPRPADLTGMRDYRIEATVDARPYLSVVTRVKVEPNARRA